MSINLEKNINNLIENYKKIGLNNRNELMSTILLMIVCYCDIDQSKYHISSSYAIRDFKPVSDLDLAMEENEWKKLDKFLPKKFGESGIYNGDLRYLIKFSNLDEDAELEIFCKNSKKGYPNNRFSHNSLQNKFLKDSYGHLYYSLDTFVNWKSTVHRNKDKDHIVLLKNNIKRISNNKNGPNKLKTMGLPNSNSTNHLIKKMDNVLSNWNKKN